MHEFSIVKEFVDRAKAQGIKQGIEHGLRQGTIDSILTLLGTQFPPNAVRALRPALETIDDLPRLKGLLIAASNAESFEEFAQTLYK